MTHNVNIRQKILLIGMARAVFSLAVVIPLVAVFTDISGGDLAIISVVLFVAVFLGEYLVVLGMRRVVDHALAPVIEFSRSLSSGDLSRRLEKTSTDAVGELVDSQNMMVDGLRLIIEKLQEAATQVSATAEELAASSEEVMASAEEVSSTVEQISTGSEAQARSVEETSEIINEIAKMGANVAEQARVSSDTARTANDIAREGSVSAESAAERMEEMQLSIDSVTEIMHGLGERSMQIGLIVDVITSIADQTNMLALNAAIEASRAGEHGRGFAVVADEVRRLAEESRKSADQIAKMIRDTEAETSKALQAMDTSREMVGSSIEVIQSTLDALRNVAEIVEDIAGGAESVYKATEAQREGYDRVVKDAHDIAAIAEEAAAGTQQASAAANEQTASMQQMRASIQELARLSVEMKHLVDDFRLSGER